MMLEAIDTIISKKYWLDIMSGQSETNGQNGRKLASGQLLISSSVGGAVQQLIRPYQFSQIYLLTFFDIFL